MEKLLRDLIINKKLKNPYISSEGKTSNRTFLNSNTYNIKNRVVCDILNYYENKKPKSFDFLEELLTCPISYDIFLDPIVCDDGHTYSKNALDEWFNQPNCYYDRSPITNAAITKQIPNLLLKKIIHMFMIDNIKKIDRNLLSKDKFDELGDSAIEFDHEYIDPIFTIKMIEILRVSNVKMNKFLIKTLIKSRINVAKKVIDSINIRELYEIDESPLMFKILYHCDLQVIDYMLQKMIKNKLPLWHYIDGKKMTIIKIMAKRYSIKNKCEKKSIIHFLDMYKKYDNNIIILDLLLSYDYPYNIIEKVYKFDYVNKNVPKNTLLGKSYKIKHLLGKNNCGDKIDDVKKNDMIEILSYILMFVIFFEYAIIFIMWIDKLYEL